MPPCLRISVRTKNLSIKSALLLILLLLPQTVIAQPGNLPVPEITPVNFAEIPTETYSNKVLCNCYLMVKQHIPNLSGINVILKNITSTGTVAVFYYPKSQLHHFAIVLETTERGYFIEETNYAHCAHSYRWVSKNDTNLLGFYTPQ